MSRIDEIRERRSALVARAAIERMRCSAQIERWRSPLAVADKVAAAAHSIRSHPGWLAAAAALILVLRPKRALAWAQRGVVLWRAWRWITQSALPNSARKPGWRAGR